MGRKFTGYWDQTKGRWRAAIGEIGPSGRRRPVVLVGPNGKPLGPNDAAMVRWAIERQRAEIAAAGQPPNEGAVGPPWSLADLFREYRRAAVKARRRARTVADIDFHCRRFLAACGNRLACEIGPEDWFRYERLPGGAKRQTFNVVRAALEWAARPISGREPAQVIDRNPWRGIRPVRNPRPRGDAPEWDQTRAILRTMRAYARSPVSPRGRPRRTRVSRWLRAACFTFGAYTGCRTGETVGLTWKEVDLAAGIVRLDPDRAKTAKRRSLPLGRCARLIRAIASLPERHKTWVFWPSSCKSAREAEHWRWLREDVRPWAATQGRAIPARWQPYDLRRGWATDAIEALGEDRAAAVLGHSPEVLRTIYDRPGDRRARTAGAEVAAFRAGRKVK
ncbi:Phage integrase family protein [Aquisphaera giovannonii]|uniref:Phage integrase family protein n=1 Tax=Aquisphaera giovannonii TaxID=406548 RepID=A0A5B9WBT3_9BACT|nr:tyrosine-type recombinase/integrase [Aquisphaera giovannonii]QEH37933.1 Phage integrase family protein [Aquisphaera giovannonii]